ncbi:MAG: carbamoyl phosphate synthase-like protein [Phycisphaerae bacterium]|nr:MAG: carbamoyl phosphate synthase-like protein [Phycisphaerae bacterium]
MKRRQTSKPNTRRKATTASPDLRILFTCVGRRIELLNAFRQAARKLRITLEVHGADINRTAPAIHTTDVAHLIPRIGHRDHISALLALVKKHKINAIIPLIDSDLLALSRAASRFAKLGCTVVISKQSVIKTCADKLLTYEALRDANIDTPETWTPKQALSRKRHRFPYFLKPREGSAGQGLFKINNADELRVFIKRQPDCVVQEFIEGVEHTMDVYAGFDGAPRCVVPRRRLEVRTGEVSKGLIVKDPSIIEVGRTVAQTIAGFKGVITVQCMATPAGRISVIEINPRFGGGAPLSIHAGADFPKWLMAELMDKPVRIREDEYQDNIAMLRYDESLFVDGDGVSLLEETSKKKVNITERKT